MHKYQETLYQLNEEDYIGTQSVKTKGKKADVKIYNALGKNNDRADFNMILTSLGGIYDINHNYDDLKADWDRADKNHRWQETKRMAAELGIPIAVIDGTQCTKLEFEKVQEMVRTVKEEKRMDLIPEIIHKIENNKAAQMGLLKDVRNEIFSDTKVKKLLEKIIGTIITSDINTFNQGIEDFTKVTKKIKCSYLEKSDEYLEKCKTYDYDGYLDRLKVLFSSRNGLSGNDSLEPKEKTIDNQLEQNSEEIDL